MLEMARQINTLDSPHLVLPELRANAHWHAVGSADSFSLRRFHGGLAIWACGSLGDVEVFGFCNANPSVFDQATSAVMDGWLMLDMHAAVGSFRGSSRSRVDGRGQQVIQVEGTMNVTFGERRGGNRLPIVSSGDPGVDTATAPFVVVAMPLGGLSHVTDSEVLVLRRGTVNLHTVDTRVAPLAI